MIKENMKVLRQMLANDIVQICDVALALASENTEKPPDLTPDKKVMVHESSIGMPAVSAQWPVGRFTAPVMAERVGLRADTIRDLAEQGVRRGELRKVGRVHGQGRAYIYERVPEAGQGHDDTEASLEMPKAA